MCHMIRLLLLEMVYVWSADLREGGRESLSREWKCSLHSLPYNLICLISFPTGLVCTVYVLFLNSQVILMRHYHTVRCRTLSYMLFIPSLYSPFLKLKNFLFTSIPVCVLRNNNSSTHLTALLEASSSHGSKTEK